MQSVSKLFACVARVLVSWLVGSRSDVCNVCVCLCSLNCGLFIDVFNNSFRSSTNASIAVPCIRL